MRRQKIISTTMTPNLNRQEEIGLNRIRVDLLLPSHLYDHNFLNIVSPNCPHCNVRCSTKHFLVQCQHPTHHENIRKLHAGLSDTRPGLSDLFDGKTLNNKCKLLLYGDTVQFNMETNVSIVESTAKFICENT